MNVSVVILTYNEEINIKDCIESSKQLTNEVFVLDSFSTDNTVQIALDLGAKVVQNKFIGYATQRNYALDQISYENQWIFMLDADERITNSVSDEVCSILEDDDSVSMYKCRRKDFFLGRWLKRSSGYPTWFPRLFKLGECSVAREINEEYFTDGDVGCLNYDIDHYPFNKGVSEWFEKHNRYSSMEAEIIYRKENTFVFFELFSMDSSARRKAQKALVYSMPFRPLIVFILFYIVKLGFLDGRAGFQYCSMKFAYELMISSKVNELNFK